MSQEISSDFPKTRALLAFGANIRSTVGGPADTIIAAQGELARAGVVFVRCSRLFSTPCVPVGAGPDFVNSAAQVVTDLTPEALLAALHRVEAAFGRIRTERWAARTLDIDLIAWGDAVRPDAATQTRWREMAPDAQARHAPDGLILPHPRMQDRAFVLIPLAEVAGDWHHPVTGQSIAQMLNALPDRDKDGVKPLDLPDMGANARL